MDTKFWDQIRSFYTAKIWAAMVKSVASKYPSMIMKWLRMQKIWSKWSLDGQKIKTLTKLLNFCIKLDYIRIENCESCPNSMICAPKTSISSDFIDILMYIENCRKFDFYQNLNFCISSVVFLVFFKRISIGITAIEHDHGIWLEICLFRAFVTIFGVNTIEIWRNEQFAWLETNHWDCNN